MKIYIDTELWIFAQKVPDPSKFSNSSEYDRKKKNYELSNAFFSKHLQEDEILMTYHQICEIYHALAFRGFRIPEKEALEFCIQLINNKCIHLYYNSIDNIKQSLKLSRESGIHIWDYLCIIPFYKDVEIFYSCDDHFQHPTFQSLGPKIENPLE